MGLIIIAKNADFAENNVGNITGFPVVPAGLTGVWLPRISLAESSRNRSVLVDDSPPFVEAISSQDEGWEYKPTQLEKKAAASGLITPLRVPGNGWVMGFVVYSNPHGENTSIENLLSLEGVSFLQGGIRFRVESHPTGTTRTRVSAGWWDGENIVGTEQSLFSGTNLALTADRWNMIFLRHDPATRTLSLVCPGTGVDFHHTFPAGTDLYVNPAHSGISLFRDAATSYQNDVANKYAMFGLWDRPLSSAAIQEEAYPALKDYMIEQGIPVL